VPMVESEGVEGVVQLARNGRPFSAGDRDTLQILAEQIIIAIKNATLIDKQRQLTSNVFRAIARACDSQDPRKQGHSEKVSVLADKLALQLGLDDSTREHLRLAALLHGVGRLTAPSDAPEWGDPVVALSLIENMELDSAIGEMIKHHREAWDNMRFLLEPYGLLADEVRHPCSNRPAVENFGAFSGRRQCVHH